MSHASVLIAAALGGIVLLLFFVMKLRLHAFVALLLVSLLVGVATGMPLTDIVETVKKGMGGTLGFVATVVGLGAMFGKMLEVSGGVDRLANTLLKRFGEGRSQWAMAIAGFMIAIPVFLDVGFIILVPLIYALGKRTGRSLLHYGIPLLAGLAVTHSFMPPTPGPIAVANLINADLGYVILFGAICGLPAMILAGPVFGTYIGKRIHATVPDYMQQEAGEVRENYDDLPGFRMIASIIMLPLVLILANTVSGVMLDESSMVYQVLGFFGSPIVALLITTLLAFTLLGTKRGLSREEVMGVATKSLEPAGIIILVTGAGGVFKQTLIDSGVGDVIGHYMADSSLPPVLLAFIIATGVRVIQGSATVAMITAAGLMAPVITQLDLSGPILGLIVIAIASGATVLSHVNDSGFWLVNRYFGLTEAQTLKSWTVMETIIGVVGIIMALILTLFI
ncbi:GntP family permease [Larsenimonas rhizosphaerae]|uniref:Gluconate:H+ symporter n=1 Tax=Larsenimonas rhizosphaerae TaxID=2944682 RepID=A0AA41ZD79_9GAMM|nr:gluconate:H+ symporter [Larsenimonas rhizosphaerae]MCX2522672.1 gluconate:H+ symporter [Larsenimonas rhizosphaerae]